MRAVLILLLLGACAAKAPAPEPAPPPPPAGMVVQISKSGLAAREFVEELAARCWLDGIVRGAAMIMDRNTGRVIIDGDSRSLLIAEFLPPSDGRTRVRITGPAADDPATALKIARSVDQAEKTGQTACPVAEG